jgi:hypothetical protein
MSILADLLSKSNPAEPQSGKDIPPTLARAQGAAAHKRTPKRRFVVVAVAAAAIVAVGLVTSTMLGRLATRTTVKYPLPPQLPPTAAPPQQASVAPPPQLQVQQAATGPAPSQTADKPRASFETKPSPRKRRNRLPRLLPAGMAIRGRIWLHNPHPADRPSRAHRKKTPPQLRPPRRQRPLPSRTRPRKVRFCTPRAQPNRPETGGWPLPITAAPWRSTRTTTGS